GVSGSGKSTLGQALADTLGMPFLDGDSLHPKGNIEKMSSGQPLADSDRLPWLALIRTTIDRIYVDGSTGRNGVVVACSALKKSYRNILRGVSSAGLGVHKPPPPLPTYFVFLNGSRDTLLQRISHRHGHFMKASMLDTQLEILESPVGEQDVIGVSIEESPSVQLKMATDHLQTAKDKKKKNSQIATHNHRDDRT
ncbi:hypothetical protein BG004_004499, partial [Podila humilis]